MTVPREEFDTVVRELRDAVAQNRADLKIQCERIAQMQAELDSLRMAAERRSSRKKVSASTGGSCSRRRTLMPRSARVVRDPDPPAPSLVCPSCDEHLRFRETIYGGVSPEERWDHRRAMRP
jgi:hypothetical protein